MKSKIITFWSLLIAKISNGPEPVESLGAKFIVFFVNIHTFYVQLNIRSIKLFDNIIFRDASPAGKMTLENKLFSNEIFLSTFRLILNRNYFS